jgi:hypothetical protein
LATLIKVTIYCLLNNVYHKKRINNHIVENKCNIASLGIGATFFIVSMAIVSLNIKVMLDNQTIASLNDVVEKNIALYNQHIMPTYTDKEIDQRYKLDALIKRPREIENLKSEVISYFKREIEQKKAYNSVFATLLFAVSLLLYFAYLKTLSNRLKLTI